MTIPLHSKPCLKLHQAGLYFYSALPFSSNQENFKKTVKTVKPLMNKFHKINNFMLVFFGIWFLM